MTDLMLAIQARIAAVKDEAELHRQVRFADAQLDVRNLRQNMADTVKSVTAWMAERDAAQR